MTKHTDREFEIVRAACHLWQSTAQVWEERALKAEAELNRVRNNPDSSVGRPPEHGGNWTP